MKNRVYAIVIGMAFSLTTVSVSQAMSELVSLSIEPEWPATSSPGTVIVYKLSAVAREGQGMLEVSLSTLGLPDGATVSFSPDVLRFTGRAPECLTSTVTITCTNLTATDNYPFTITGAALRETVTLTNQPVQTPYGVVNGPAVLALDRLSGGGLRLRGAGATGQTYQIESTPDLSKPAWTLVGSTTADGNGRFTFVTAQAAGASMRFYRAVGSAVGLAATP